jgi:hypothetical protein
MTEYVLNMKTKPLREYSTNYNDYRLCFTIKIDVKGNILMQYYATDWKEHEKFGEIQTVCQVYDNIPLSLLEIEIIKNLFNNGEYWPYYLSLHSIIINIKEVLKEKYLKEKDFTEKIDDLKKENQILQQEIIMLNKQKKLIYNKELDIYE